MLRNSLLLIVLTLLIQSCASKKDILYFQDSEQHKLDQILYENSKIQPNDILSIVVTTPVPEAAIPYNVQSAAGMVNFDIEALKLQGYLVSENNVIDFPVLGEISVDEMSIEDLELEIKKLLETGGHLKDASVNARLLNAKVTILGEVKIPGTYPFTEKSISVLQALGYAGDLTIFGKRKDIMLIREENGVRSINSINLTSADWFGSPYYYVKPNDIILVNPNNTKVKSSGFIGSAGIVLTIASLILSSIVIISR